MCIEASCYLEYKLITNTCNNYHPVDHLMTHEEYCMAQIIQYKWQVAFCQ